MALFWALAVSFLKPKKDMVMFFPAALLMVKCPVLSVKSGCCFIALNGDTRSNYGLIGFLFDNKCGDSVLCFDDNG